MYPKVYVQGDGFMDDFKRVFGKVDKAFFLDIHPARENKEDYPDISSKNIVASLENADITATVLAMDAIGKQFNVNLVVSASVEADTLSDAIKDKVVANC